MKGSRILMVGAASLVALAIIVLITVSIVLRRQNIEDPLIPANPAPVAEDPRGPTEYESTIDTEVDLDRSTDENLDESIAEIETALEDLDVDEDFVEFEDI